MSDLTPTQERTRERVEALIKVMAPTLDLVLAAGDRLSRVIEPEDYDYYPARPFGKRVEAAAPPEGDDRSTPS